MDWGSSGSESAVNYQRAEAMPTHWRVDKYTSGDQKRGGACYRIAITTQD